MFAVAGLGTVVGFVLGRYSAVGMRGVPLPAEVRDATKEAIKWEKARRAAIRYCDGEEAKQQRKRHGDRPD